MAQVTLPYQLTDGTVADAAQVMSNFTAITNQVNGNIDNTNLSSTLTITDSKLSQIQSAAKVNGTALTNLAGIPSGAGVIPSANLIYQNIQYPYVKVSNTQNSGTSGGTATSGSWLTAIINTTDNDTQSISSLAANALSLPAGTYIMSGRMPIGYAAGGQEAQIRLYNSTGAAILINGMTNSTTSAADIGVVCPVSGLFTLSTTSNVILQYQVATTVNTSGQGLALSYGTEVYAQMEFTKIQ